MENRLFKCDHSDRERLAVIKCYVQRAGYHGWPTVFTIDIKLEARDPVDRALQDNRLFRFNVNQFFITNNLKRLKPSLANSESWIGKHKFSNIYNVITAPVLLKTRCPWFINLTVEQDDTNWTRKTPYNMHLWVRAVWRNPSHLSLGHSIQNIIDKPVTLMHGTFLQVFFV